MEPFVLTGTGAPPSNSGGRSFRVTRVPAGALDRNFRASIFGANSPYCALRSPSMPRRRDLSSRLMPSTYIDMFALPVWIRTDTVPTPAAEGASTHRRHDDLIEFFSAAGTRQAFTVIKGISPPLIRRIPIVSYILHAYFNRPAPPIRLGLPLIAGDASPPMARASRWIVLIARPTGLLAVSASRDRPRRQRLLLLRTCGSGRRFHTASLQRGAEQLPAATAERAQ